MRSRSCRNQYATSTGLPFAASTVVVQHIITKGTIDERIMKALSEKDTTQAALIIVRAGHSVRLRAADAAHLLICRLYLIIRVFDDKFLRHLRPFPHRADIRIQEKEPSPSETGHAAVWEKLSAA